MINICFVPCFGKGELYRDLADKLVKKYKNDIKIYWIIVDKRYQTINRTDSRLYIDFSISKNNKSEEFKDFRINEIIYSDRVLNKNIDKGKKYLINLEYILYDYIKEHRINIIIGERAQAHELLLGRICNLCPELKCEYYSMTDIRIPSFRFAFFKDEKETELVEFNNKCDVKEFKLEKPSYLQINDKLQKLNSYFNTNRIKRIFTYIKQIDKNNVSGQRSFCEYVNFVFSRLWNKFWYKTIKKEEFDINKYPNFIFYGFHKQPESSIDVCGRYNEDQYIDILNIWRMLPAGWYLILKEHTNAVGDRNKDFYKSLMKLTGVVLVNEHTDSYKLISNAKITFSVTGTISLEAGLMNKKAITLSKTFFNRISTVYNYSFNELEKMSINDLVEKKEKDNVNNYKKYILSNSFKGCVLDSYTLPSVLCDENLDKIIYGYDSLFRLNQLI